MATHLYWHFLPCDRRLRFKPHTLVETGSTIRTEGEPVLCQRGLHASWKALDALNYAPYDEDGLWICRVRLGGKVLSGADKVVATKRTVVWMAEATRTLHEFGVWCAMGALVGSRCVDDRSIRAIAAKEEWLTDVVDDSFLDAARVAAGDAARAAAWTAAEDAAGDAARAAARNAAWTAAGAAAGAAARDAARDAARAAAGAAAWTAAGAAAGAAAWDMMNVELTRRLEELR